MSENKGLVVATEYFQHPYAGAPILKEVLECAATRRHISGLWVPQNITHDMPMMDELSKLASGVNFNEYRPKGGLGYKTRDIDETHDSANQDAEKAQDRSEAIRMIIDFSSSTGVNAIAHNIHKVLKAHPAPKLGVTLSLDAGHEGLSLIPKIFEKVDTSEEPIEFYLRGVYPEQTAKGTANLYLQSEEDRTEMLSKVVDDYGLNGLVGAANLAKHTRQGQYYLAMGVTRDGLDYISRAERFKGDKQGVDIVKRASTVAQALDGASNTQLLLGRTLVYRDAELIDLERLIPGSTESDNVVAFIRKEIVEIHEEAIAA